MRIGKPLEVTRAILIRVGWQWRGRRMAGQTGFFDAQERVRRLSVPGNPLARLRAVEKTEAFRWELDAALLCADCNSSG